MIVGGSDQTADKKVAIGIPTNAEPAPALSPVIETPKEAAKPAANEYDAVVEAAPANEYDAIIETTTSDQGTALKTAMKTAQDTVPDQYAKAKLLSQKTGIPVDSVERNLPDVEKQAPWLTNEYDDLLKNNPSTAAFLAENDHAKLAKDDIQNLTALEQIARLEENDSWLPNNLGKVFMHGLANTNRSITQIPAGVFAAATLPGNLLAKATGTGQVEVPDWLLNNPAAEYFKRAAESYSVDEMNGNAWEDIKTGDLKKASRTLAAQIVMNAPSQFTSVGTMLMGAPTAGLSFMGATSGAAQLSKNADDKDIDKDPAQTAMDMLMNGGIEVLGEKYGTFGIFKVIEKSVAKQFGKATAKALVAEVGKNIALAFGGEGAEEFSTQLGQDLSDYVTGNPRALEGSFSRAANAFLIGAGSGVTMTSPTAVYSGVVKSHRLNMDQKFWDSFTGMVADKTNGSKLRERDPGAFEIHVGKVLEDSGKPTSLYIAPDALKQFFQTDEAAFNSFIDDMQIRDQLQEAMAAGKDFEISAAKFATKYAGSPLSAAIKEDIRFTPDGMTLREQGVLKEALARNVEEMRREYATMVEETRLPAQAQAMREKLMLPKAQGGFGISAEDADAKIGLWAAYTRAMAPRVEGETTDSFFARINPALNVGGEYVDGSGLAQADNQEAAKSQIRQTTLQKIKALYGGKYTAINGFLEGTVNAAAISKDPAAKENLLKLREEMRAEQQKIDNRQGELFQKIKSAFDEEENGAWKSKEVGKSSLSRYGFGPEASGFADTAEILYVKGVPAIAYHFNDAALDGFSVAKKFRRQGLGVKFIQEQLAIFNHLMVEAPNEEMLAMLKKAGDVKDIGGSTYDVTPRQGELFQKDQDGTSYGKLVAVFNSGEMPPRLVADQVIPMLKKAGLTDHDITTLKIQEHIDAQVQDEVGRGLSSMQETERAKALDKEREDIIVQRDHLAKMAYEGLAILSEPGAVIYAVDSDGTTSANEYRVMYSPTGEEIDTKQTVMPKSNLLIKNKEAFRSYIAMQKKLDKVLDRQMRAAFQAKEDAPNTNKKGMVTFNLLRILNRVDKSARGIPSDAPFANPPKRKTFPPQTAQDYKYEAMKAKNQEIYDLSMKAQRMISRLINSGALEKYSTGPMDPTWVRIENLYMQKGEGAFREYVKDPALEEKMLQALKIKEDVDRLETRRDSGVDELFQTVPVDGNALVAMHNLSAEGLLHADKMGGLAVPSVSVGKQAHPLTGFGEISLVAAKELVDPRASANNAVFNADVYSPRYPNVEYDFPRDRVATATPEIKAAGVTPSATLGGEMDAASVEYRGFREFSEMTILKLAYLNSIGIDYKVPAKKAKTPTLNLDPELKKLYKSNSIYFGGEAKDIPGFLEAYERARLKERENFIKKDMKNTGATQAEAEATYEELFKGVWYEEDGTPSTNVIRAMAHENDMLREKGKPDYYEARNRISEMIRKGHEADYLKYARQIFDSLQPEESIRHGETSRGDARYLPHNLENVVRAMKSKMRDGEGFNYGAGSVRATVAKKFSSISDMQAHRDQVIPKEEMEALKEEVNQELFDIMDEFKPYSNGGLNGFGGANAFCEHLKEMTTRGTAAVVKDYYQGYVPADVLQKANDFLNKLRNMPTEYFEAKIRRAVGLNEFSAALVPDNVSQETLDILKKNGIETVVKYDRNKGNTDERAAALKELRKARPELFFQDTGAVRGSVQFTDSQTIINLFASANMSTFLHETGHVFLKDIQALVAAGKADTQLLADYETIKAWAGDLNTVEAQEKWARGFEAYLREGKAPSLKLVNAFRRFKQWLTAIYKTVAGLNVEITPEIRDVFDRLLASESEILEAERFYGLKQSLVDLVPMDPIKRTKMKQQEFDAQQTALERQAKTLLRAYLEATGGKAALRLQAEKEIDAMPVYKALKMALESGGVDTKPLILSIGKDAVEALKQRFPGVFKRVSTPKGRTYDQEVRSRGGIDPRTMGEYEVTTFNEQKGSKGVLRNGGGAWDDMASAMEEEGILQVPENRNASDYLRELVEQKKEIPQATPVEPQEQITLPELAAANEYESPDALLADIQKAGRRSAAITARAKELLKTKEQEILEDIQKQELIPGEEAVHNDATLTYLIAEAEVLGEKLDRKQAGRPEVIERKAYQAAAVEVIGRKKVSLAGRYDLYANAEQRYAKQAYALTEQGDFAGAFEAKRKQILNHMMVQEAIRARDEKIAIEKSFRPKKFKARLNNVENAFAEAAIDLASAYGLSDMEAKGADPLSGLADADETLDSMIPAWIRGKRKPDGFKDYRDLPMNDLRELDSVIDAVLTVGSDAMKSIEAGEAKTLKEWTEASIKEMENLKDRTESGLQKYRDDSSRWSKFFQHVDAFVSATTLTQMLTDWMDNFSFLKTGNAGPFKKLYNKVLKAEVEFNASKTEVMQATKKAWSILGSAAERIHALHGTQITIPGVEMSEDMKRTDRAYWSVNRMIALLLNTGNTGNLEVAKRGLGFTDTQIQKVAAMFTAEELNALQTIWDATNLLYPKLDQVHFAIYNRNVAKVEAAPVQFTSLDGQVVQLKGGYYPLVFDHALSDRAAALQEDDMMKNQTAAVIRSVKPSDGMTKGRVEGHSLPPMLDTAVWFTHIDRTARYISHARILRDLNRFTRDKEWAKEFRKKAGDAHYKTLRSWLQHNANPGRKLMNHPLDRVASYLKSTATAAVLGFKVAVGVKQRVALINTAQALGRKDMREGWSWILKAYKEVDYRTSVAGVSNGATWEAILKKSKYLKTRDGNIDREISDLRRGIDPFAKKITIKGREFTAKDVQDFAFEWIKMNDRSVVAITWTAAFNQYMQTKAGKLTPDEAESAAIAYADGIVQDTQASSLTPELSEMQRQEGWLRLFTSFMTSAVNYGNRLTQNHRAWTTGAITNKEYMNHVMHEVIAFPWVTLLISEAFRGKLPEWWDFLLAPFEAFASFMPVIRDVFAYKYGKGVGDSPIFELPRRTVKAVAGIPELMMGDKEFTAFLWDVGRAAEAYFKVPALNFVKDVTTVIKNLTGEN